MALADYFRRRKTESIELSEVEISWLGVTGRWIADRAQQQAAWEMYVELLTRVATQPVASDEGLIREALSSLHSLFGETRRVLREHGPKVAVPAGQGRLSFAQLALQVLNDHLRPFLSKWHPRLEAHEATRPNGTSVASHEAAWNQIEAARADLERVRKVLGAYGGLLSRACGVAPLHNVPALPSSEAKAVTK